MIELPFDTLTVPGERARDALREQRDTPGIVPIILGGKADLDGLAENLAFLREDPAAIIARAERIDVAAWYEERYAQDPTAYAIDEGDWPASLVPYHDLLAIRRPDSDELLDEVVIGLVRAAEPWMVPAVLGFGGWNDCPQPHEHVALCRRWHRQFGAVVASVVGNLLEFEVARPPLDEEAAELLATEHLIYCPDILGEDGQTLRDFAATLMFGSTWSFDWS